MNLSAKSWNSSKLNIALIKCQMVSKFSCYIRFRSNVLLVNIRIQDASINMILLYARCLKNDIV